MERETVWYLTIAETPAVAAAVVAALLTPREPALLCKIRAGGDASQMSDVACVRARAQACGIRLFVFFPRRFNLLHHDGELPPPHASYKAEYLEL